MGREKTTSFYTATQSRRPKIPHPPIMFQSIRYHRFVGYNKKTMLGSYEYDLTDSDFSCVVIVDTGIALTTAAVIQEYTKRNLNVAKNLLLYFRWREKNDIHSIADQIVLADKYVSLFTPKLKDQLQKYLPLL
jgi:hypothetical protein